MTSKEERVNALYRDTVCLAPMVRAGTLPLRLLALHYGADTVYGEELIDQKIVHTSRIVNPVLNTVDYVSTKGPRSIVFRTCAIEKEKIVYQMGTANSVRALQAAQHVIQDVAAIDINMGCPKKFSIQGGMGASLLSKPEIASDIIKTLCRNLPSVPISCKIRISATTHETLDFVKAMEMAGASAIGIHAREIHERPTDSAKWEQLRMIPESIQIPVIANGDIFQPQDIAAVKSMTNCSSVMIARGALMNPSIFQTNASTLLPIWDVLSKYCHFAIETDNVYQNSKYNLSRMIAYNQEELGETMSVANLAAIKTAREMYQLFRLDGAYDAWITSKKTCLAKQESYTTTAYAHEDAYVTQNAFFCKMCRKQLQSQADMDVHVKGKKHKKKVREVAATSVLCSGLADETTRRPEPEEETHERVVKKQRLSPLRVEKHAHGKRHSNDDTSNETEQVSFE